MDHFRLMFAYALSIGGERASTTRMREVGQICCACKVLLKHPPARERYCDKCAPKRRVYMLFMKGKDGWDCHFLEEDLKTSLRRTLMFQDPRKIEEMAQRGGAGWTLAGRCWSMRFSKVEVLCG